MIRGTAGKKDDTSRSSDVGELRTKASEGNLISIKVHTTAHCVDDRFGLVVDFFLHKVREGALLDLGEFLLEMLDVSHGRNSVVTTQTMDLQVWF